MQHQAHIESLRAVFSKYASVVRSEQQFMTPDDFVVNFLRLVDTSDGVNRSFVNCVTRAVDRTKDGLISFEEFVAFEAVLARPDALYQTAFGMFDTEGTGLISFDDLKEILTLTNPHLCLPFNFDCDFVKLHFGEDKTRKVDFNEFTQLIHDIADEHAVQAFRSFDNAQTGTIAIKDFKKMVQLLKSPLLNTFMKENVISAVFQGDKQTRVSFAYYTAFVNLLSNMELVKRAYLSRTNGDKRVELTKDDLLVETQHFIQLTPMELDILFQLGRLLRPDGRISYEELAVISPLVDDSIHQHNYAAAVKDSVQRQVDLRGRTIFLSVLEQCYRFLLGSVAGAFGATVVYPIDLVKTRMQNQRTGSAIGELIYKNSWDCFRKVIRFESFFGLYRGLVPQLLGVAPEKAIKLTVNDLVRDNFTSPTTGSIHLWAEVLAGGCAGASQVVFTNPLEIVKIRLQVAGEIANTRRISALSVIKDLGFFGLYNGSRACFLRDIPFSAIYFTAYSHLKARFADAEGYNSPGSLFVAATLSGAPAACLTTPADVIKTRLQVVARTGQTSYKGLVDAASKIYQEEGGLAFWKGAGARVFRSSPQFGVTLVVYEMLQRFFYVDFGGRALTGKGVDHHIVPVSSNPDHVGAFRLASATFTGIETKLGLSFPKYSLH